jgi:hypothetical protein
MTEADKTISAFTGFDMNLYIIYKHDIPPFKKKTP